MLQLKAISVKINYFAWCSYRGSRTVFDLSQVEQTSNFSANNHRLVVFNLFHAATYFATNSTNNPF